MHKPARAPPRGEGEGERYLPRDTFPVEVVREHHTHAHLHRPLLMHTHKLTPGLPPPLPPPTPGPTVARAGTGKGRGVGPVGDGREARDAASHAAPGPPPPASPRPAPPGPADGQWLPAGRTGVHAEREPAGAKPAPARPALENEDPLPARRPLRAPAPGGPRRALGGWEGARPLPFPRDPHGTARRVATHPLIPSPLSPPSPLSLLPFRRADARSNRCV